MESCLELGGRLVGRRGVSLTHYSVYLCGLGPTNKPKAGLGLLELGVHLSYSPGYVALCGSGFLHEVGDWLGVGNGMGKPAGISRCTRTCTRGHPYHDPAGLPIKKNKK